jgi:hypothetical protein
VYVQSSIALSNRDFSIPKVRLSVWGPLAFFAAHIPLALAMRQYAMVGLLHAVGALALGLWCTVFRSRPERIAYVAAYLTGAEVLWRMTQTPVFWEFGKYAVAGLFIVSMVVRRSLKAPALPLTYFALLLVSVAISSSSMDFQTARKEISFNLSGPLALMVSAWFFSQIELSRDMMVRCFSALIGPVVGVASLALFSTLIARDLSFATRSNFVTSGGFGPNQVAAALGLGALLAYLCIVESRASYSLRILMLGTLVILAAQSALTFSRAGLYISVGSAIAGSFWLMRSNRGRITVIVVAGALFTIGDYVVFPKLESVTAGVVASRFQSTKLTGRDRFASAELTAWSENPIFGLGPGGSEGYRHRLLSSSGELVASHTEYTRLLAEHGVFGINALLLLLAMAIRNLKRANTTEGKMLVTSFLVWSLLFMAANAMRLVAPSLLFGLTFATFLPEGRMLYTEWQSRNSVSRKSFFGWRPPLPVRAHTS